MKAESKKKLYKIAKIIGILVCVGGLFGYIFFQYIPQTTTKRLLHTFELAVRDNNKDILNKIISKETIYWEILEKEDWQNELSKFHEGIEIYSIKYMPISMISSQNDIIVAEGKMKAVKDGKYRKNFPIILVKENGEWKVESFYFPGFLDY